MFRDTSEELARLEAELLAEEEPEEELLSDEEEEEPWQDEEEEEEEFPNYANGYRAYNSDETDEDLDYYSEEVRTGNRARIGCLAVLLCVLSVVLAAALIIWLAYERGFLRWN